MRSPMLCADAFYSPSEIQWFVPSGAEPDWQERMHAFGCVIHCPARKAGESEQGAGQHDASALRLLFNASETEIAFRLPVMASSWRLVMDTCLPTRRDILDASPQTRTDNPGGFMLSAHALAVLSCGAVTPDEPVTL